MRNRLVEERLDLLLPGNIGRNSKHIGAILRSSAATTSNASADRADTTTSQPAIAKDLASTCPKPLEPPVTSATLPSQYDRRRGLAPSSSAGRRFAAVMIGKAEAIGFSLAAARGIEKT